MKLTTVIHDKKLPFLTEQGIKYEVIERKDDMVSISVDASGTFFLNDLFHAGYRYGVERMRETRIAY